MLFIYDDYLWGTHVEVGVRVCNLSAAMASPTRAMAKIAASIKAIIRFVFMFVFSLWIQTTDYI
jgi:hypothetical protein